MTYHTAITQQAVFLLPEEDTAIMTVNLAEELDRLMLAYNKAKAQNLELSPQAKARLLALLLESFLRGTIGY